MIIRTVNKLDFTTLDVGKVIDDLSVAIAKKDVPIKQGIIPQDIME